MLKFCYISIDLIIVQVINFNWWEEIRCNIARRAKQEPEVPCSLQFFFRYSSFHHLVYYRTGVWCVQILYVQRSLARLVTNSYEIFYDRTRKMWPFNTGDFFIEVTARAGVIAYTIISRVSIIYGSWMFWHFLLIADVH